MSDLSRRINRLDQLWLDDFLAPYVHLIETPAHRREMDVVALFLRSQPVDADGLIDVEPVVAFLAEKPGLDPADF